MSRYQTACALIKTRISLRPWLALLSSICIGLTIGCSAAELAADEGASYNAEDDFAGEMSDDDSNAGSQESMASPNVDYGFAEPDVAGEEDDGSEVVAEAGVGEPACLQSASSDDGAFVICLDELASSTDRNSSQEPPDPVNTDASTTQCDLAEALSKTIEEQTGEAVSCVDQDADCYYHCEGWTLPNELQDPDDQRSFITGVPSGSNHTSSGA